MLLLRGSLVTVQDRDLISLKLNFVASDLFQLTETSIEFSKVLDVCEHKSCDL